MKRQKKIYTFVLVLLVLIGSVLYEKFYPSEKVVTNTPATVQLIFPSDRFPETGRHIKDAIVSGESSICTIDRAGAEENRKKSLQDVPTKKGYDRDEWPMAMCDEGGTGADIKYINPSDNRGAGSWVSNQLEKYPDGTKVEFIVK
ncbi:NucA/NucB deoxyribonuclease domain-containing protein [Paenibacillus rigui]|uniref:DNA-entry nuclease n=1 Tax=Paenibacillus rigui TaxID=554312 RepID=A0A229UML1_9BACL|nr:NucA/NucB deoxyribonuclease domain-containing protein [Paenibacillus rigui]OXM84622.1 DNA-entry nuclease [Paenibacillus rigui]